MIHIVQLLCPSRHCVYGCAFDPTDSDFKTAKAAMQEQMKELKCNSWCGICGSRNLRFEESRTRFKTMEEAAPVLKQLEAQQALSRLLLASEGRTYDEGGNRN